MAPARVLAQARVGEWRRAFPRTRRPLLYRVGGPAVPGGRCGCCGRSVAGATVQKLAKSMLWRRCGFAGGPEAAVPPAGSWQPGRSSTRQKPAKTLFLTQLMGRMVTGLALTNLAHTTQWGTGGQQSFLNPVRWQLPWLCLQVLEVDWLGKKLRCATLRRRSFSP